EAEGEQVTVEDIRHWDERWDYSRFEKVRVVAQDEEGVAVGYGELHHEPDRFDARRYFLHLAVDPAYQRRGVATAIWEHMREELAQRAATVVRLRTDAMGPGAQWADRQGFRWAGEDRISGKVTYERRLDR
ncbi:MAG: GNAT family N-acetyltransferase, partial [Chloroflexi bacterium]|nr:GNAT family N-acetyltransferase [Chloroflexota bacterium]